MTTSEGHGQDEGQCRRRWQHGGHGCRLEEHGGEAGADEEAAGQIRATGSGRVRAASAASAFAAVNDRVDVLGLRSAPPRVALSGPSKTQPIVGAAPHLVCIRVVLAVVFPSALVTDVEARAAVQGKRMTASALIQIALHLPGRRERPRRIYGNPSTSRQ